MQNTIPTHWIQPFRNKDLASQLLARLTSGVTPAHLQFMDRLVSEISNRVDRDRILNNFERLADSVIDKPALFRTLSDFPPIIARIVHIFHASQFLADILIRDPQYVSYLISPETYCRPLDRELAWDEIQTILGNETFSDRRKLDALRILRRRHTLMIGVRDLILSEELETIVYDLSLLADVVTDAVLHVHTENMAPANNLAVIALGKWGGQELNYSSDIDLLFVYPEEGHGDSDLSFHEIHNRAAERVMQSLQETTREGRLYRADARLRPDGNSGPLARSMASCSHYYESRGKVWERQMLIKARPAAGNRLLGETFIRSLRPFVFPSTFFRSPIEEIARMKWKMEEEQSAPEWNIKIAPGGIRDIEFVIQALQLINGGKLESIRTPTTLVAVEKLCEANLLKVAEADTLRDAYHFYRRIEHLVQIERDLQTHRIEENKLEQERLGQLLGFSDRHAFLRQLETMRPAVRAIFDGVFVKEGESPLSKSLIQDQWDVTVRSRLREANVVPSARVQQSLLHLAFGHLPKLYDNTTRSLFEQLLPSLVAAAGKTPSPEDTLVRFERLVYAYPSPNSLYRILLSSPSHLSAFVYLSSLGPHMSNVLVESPGLIEYLITRMGAWSKRPHEMDRGPTVRLSQFKALEWIRLAILDREEKLNDAQLYGQLSHIADQSIREVWNERIDPSYPMVLAALGKWGGRDLSFRSDLDVVWICADDADLSQCQVHAEAIMKSVREVTQYGRLYEIDARLRPEGAHAPLVVSQSRYLEYFSSRAAFWEKQALIRWRPVCGAEPLARSIASALSPIRYHPLTSDDIDSIMQMRQKQMSEKIRRPEDALSDIKFSAGGMLDIEYAVQACQIHWAENREELQTTSIYEAFDALGSMLPGDSVDQLRRHYHFFRQLEKFAFLALERSSAKLPTDKKQIDILEHFCDISSETNLLTDLSRRKKEVESVFRQILVEEIHD